MSLKRTDTDIRPKIDLKFSTKGMILFLYASLLKSNIFYFVQSIMPFTTMCIMPLTAIHWQAFTLASITWYRLEFMDRKISSCMGLTVHWYSIESFTNLVHSCDFTMILGFSRFSTNPPLLHSLFNITKWKEWTFWIQDQVV